MINPAWVFLGLILFLVVAWETGTYFFMREWTISRAYWELQRDVPALASLLLLFFVFAAGFLSYHLLYGGH